MVCARERLRVLCRRRSWRWVAALWLVAFLSGYMYVGISYVIYVRVVIYMYVVRSKFIINKFRASKFTTRNLEIPTHVV